MIEQDYCLPQHNFLQRSPTFLIPLSYAFGDPIIPGFLLHRITFWKNDAQARHGKLTIDDFGAENMNIKRLLEAGSSLQFPADLSADFAGATTLSPVRDDEPHVPVDALDRRAHLGARRRVADRVLDEVQREAVQLVARAVDVGAVGADRQPVLAGAHPDLVQMH